MDHEHHHEHHHHHHDAPAVPIPEEFKVFCPVTGDPIDTREAEAKGHVRTRNGEKIYLCCATCVGLFDKHPEKYVAHNDTEAVLVLKEKEHLADNIWAFRFEPTQPMTWIAGQFIRVELPHDDPDHEGTKRFFTISSAPYEGIVQITTRVTDTTFKQALNTLPVGGQLKLLDEPDGDFVWKDSDKSIVFIAGGIGVTPFYSIIKQRVHDSQLVPVTLIYSGRDDNLAFKAEFDDWSQAHPEFTVTYVIGERLSAEKLAEVYPAINNAIVYLSGPEPMVEAIGADLERAGLSHDQMEQDFFPNYSESNY